MSFADDDFTGTNGTALAAHTATPNGGTWATGRTNDQGANGQINGNHFVSTSSQESNGWYFSVAPASADYDVQATITDASFGSVSKPYLGGRMSTTANTGYILGDSGGSWELYSVVNGAETQLQVSATDTPNQNSKVSMLRMVGTTISAWSSGVQRFSVTNNAVAAAGRPGVATYFSSNVTTSFMDAWSATDAVSGVTAAQQIGVFDQQLSGQMVGLVYLSVGLWRTSITSVSVFVWASRRRIRSPCSAWRGVTAAAWKSTRDRMATILARPTGSNERASGAARCWPSACMTTCRS